MYQINDIVCFRENNKWVGSLGFINEIKKIKDKNGKDTLRLMIGVPIPAQGTAYIFATDDEVENLQCAIKYPYIIEREKNKNESED